MEALRNASYSSVADSAVVAASWGQAFAENPALAGAVGAIPQLDLDANRTVVLLIL